MTPKIKPYTKNPVVRQCLKRPTPRKKEAPPKAKRPRIWAVDFDGTLHHGRYPNIGQPNEKLIAILKLAKSDGIKLILWTSREGQSLTEALQWCESHGLSFDAVNDNTEEFKLHSGSNPRKIFADRYIDDRAYPFWALANEEDLWGLLSSM